MSKKFNELKKIFEILHSPKGCRWDKLQTHKSLLKYLREETKEFIEAVNSGKTQDMKEELGDILLQIMFHAQLAKKKKIFTIEDVIDTLISKLKRRHPHVFGSKKVNPHTNGQSIGVGVKSVKDIITNWEKIKATETRKKQKIGRR